MFVQRTILLFLLTISLRLSSCSSESNNYLKLYDQLSKSSHDPCYETSVSKRGRKCMPDFVNAAFGREILPTSTCGGRGSSSHVLCFLADGTGVGLQLQTQTLTQQANTNGIISQKEIDSAEVNLPIKSESSGGRNTNSLLTPEFSGASAKLFSELDFSQEDEDDEEPIGWSIF